MFNSTAEYSENKVSQTPRKTDPSKRIGNILAGETWSYTSEILPFAEKFANDDCCSIRTDPVMIFANGDSEW